MNERISWLTRIEQIQSTQSIPVIAEVKPSSPGEGNLIKERSVSSIVRAYESGGAACISVVTGRWFGGHIDMLKEAASATNLPLLRKDLIVNKDQINQSRDCGANAILLTKQILSIGHLNKMVEHCVKLNVTPFIEVANARELAELSPCKEAIIAIANRDISKKELDHDSGLKSLELVTKIGNEFGALVSASGISTPIEAKTLIEAGFDGLLIGTCLLKATNPEHAVRALAG